MGDNNQLQPSGLPPIGTTTATSMGRDYTLGARRQLESKGGKAERLARRYIRKYGDAGASAARDLLGIAAAEKMGGPAIRTQAGRALGANTLKEEERSLLLRGAAAEADERRMAQPETEPEEQERDTPLTRGATRGTRGRRIGGRREKDTLTEGATAGTKEAPLDNTSTSPTTKMPSSLDYLRNPTQMMDRITGSREDAAKRKGLFGQMMDQLTPV